jgi:hypothetical protein
MLLYELHLGNLSSNHCTAVDIQYINVLMYVYFQESILKTATKIKMSHLLKNATKCENFKGKLHNRTEICQKRRFL